jgi:undecaprenyl-diphosphatase
MLKIVILALVQGLTEFFPVSSKGHLALLEHFFAVPAPEKLFLTVFLHGGTLLAAFVYFWPQIVQILTGLRLKSERGAASRRYFWAILLGSVPAGVLGLTLEKRLSELFNSLPLLSVMFLVTALALAVAGLDLYSGRRRRKSDREINIPRALVIGCAQTAALLPGISRSGSTISAGLFSGLSREEAFRFSFLLSLPAVAGAFAIEGVKGVKAGIAVPLPQLAVGFTLSFVCGLLALHFLRRLVLAGRLAWFSVYLLVLGLFTAFL